MGNDDDDFDTGFGDDDLIGIGMEEKTDVKQEQSNLIGNNDFMNLMGGTGVDAGLGGNDHTGGIIDLGLGGGGAQEQQNNLGGGLLDMDLLGGVGGGEVQTQSTTEGVSTNIDSKPFLF